MPEPVLIADSVSKAFAHRRILTSASLRAYPSELRVLFGRNGSGKSTLLKIASGAMQPDSGMVHFRGRPYLHARLWRLAVLGLLYLPDRDMLSPFSTVIRQLDLFRERFDGMDAHEALGIMDAHDLARRKPRELSNGQRRRVEFAAALVRRPACFLADEPLRGMSPLDSERLIHGLRRLCTSGTAVVVTGHETAVLLNAADHVVWCTSGTTYELGSPDAALAHSLFAREYLGMRPAQ